MKVKSKHSALLLGMAAFSATVAAAQLSPPQLDLEVRASLANSFVGADGKADVIVILSGEPATQVYARAQANVGGNGPMALSAAGSASRAAVTRLRAEQESFVTNLHGANISATELFRVQRALNGVALRVAPQDMPKLRALPGVQLVDYLPVQEPGNSTSVPFVNAPQVWENTLGLPFAAKGEGIRIGIIDTGIDYQHPDFGGTGLLAAYQANDRTTIADGYFPTAKVVGGYDFAGDAYSAGVTPPTPDDDPMDCGGHGSHVSGSAAGYGVNMDGTTYGGPWTTAPDYTTLKIGPGMAPQAKLYALRVFGCGGSTSLTVDAIDWATDPNGDLDLSDRLDVINMSLGSTYGSGFDATAVASDNASLTGMIVVASGGNSGDTYFIGGSPGSGKNVLTVANISDSGNPGTVLQLTAPAAIAGVYPASASAYTNPSLPNPPSPNNETNDIVLVDDGSTAGTGGTINDGCQTPFANAAAVSGKFALIDRGSCNFTVKAQNAQANGAVGVIVVNNVVGDPVPLVMGGAVVGAPVTIPGILVSQATGATIKQQLALPTTVHGILAVANAGDTLNASSSRGPVGAGSAFRLKPDLAAPGTNITSVQTGITCDGTATTGCIVSDPSGYIAGAATLTISGTSMAAPHVTGLMALLRQMNAGMGVEQIKAMAMNSAAHDVTLGANGALPKFGAARVGAGRIDTAAAATSKILAYNDADPGAVSITFNAEPVGIETQTQKVRLVNRTATIQTVDLAISTIEDAPGVTFTLLGSPTVTLPPAGSVTVDVQMSTDSSLMKRYRDPSMSPNQATPTTSPLAGLGSQPRHYLAEESALLKVSKSGNELARLPVFTALRPHSTMHAPTSTGFGSAPTGTTNVPLSGQSVCTGTLAGSTCTAALANDEESLVSAFELQYSGAPVAGIPAYASVRYVGVNYDTTTDAFFFGVATHGKWDTPSNTAVNICIDSNNDGSFDRVLFSGDPGNINRGVFGFSDNGQDAYMVGRFTPPSTVGMLNYVNALTAAQADTALIDNNVMFIRATAAQLVLPAGVKKFRYAVATCPRFEQLCVFLDTPTSCSSGDEYATVPGTFVYDGAAKGISTPGGGVGSALFPDISGATIPVTYNFANLATNGSTGLLLLHHHNVGSATTDVIIADRIFADGFGGD